MLEIIPRVRKRYCPFPFEHKTLYCCGNNNSLFICFCDFHLKIVCIVFVLFMYFYSNIFFRVWSRGVFFLLCFMSIFFWFFPIWSLFGFGFMSFVATAILKLIANQMKTMENHNSLSREHLSDIKSGNTVGLIKIHRAEHFGFLSHSKYWRLSTQNRKFDMLVFPSSELLWL